MDIAVYHPVAFVDRTKRGDPVSGIRVISRLWDSFFSLHPLQKQRVATARCFACLLPIILLFPASAYEPSACLVLLGDIMLGRGVAQAHIGADWESALQSLHPVTRAADLALANLESPIGCETPALTGNSRSLVAPPEAVAALSSAGLDVLSTVNNHARDAGDRGAKCTGDSLAGKGILVLDSSSTPLEIRVHGINISVLAFDFTGEVTPAAVENLERRVREASSAGKIVVVSLHWGMEYQAGHDAGQLRIARRLAASHADILWGHHPHVVQEAEWIAETLVLYSLGNAVFDQQEPESVRRGELVWIEVDRRGVRFFAELPFAIDARLGKTKSMDLFSTRFSFNPS